jgi:hypothetical protein
VQTGDIDNTCRCRSSTYVESKFAERVPAFANLPSLKIKEVGASMVVVR